MQSSMILHSTLRSGAFNRRGNETALGRFLSRVCPHVRRTQRRLEFDEYDDNGRLVIKKKRVYVYDFGTVHQCREAWVKTHGKVFWEDVDDTDY